MSGSKVYLEFCDSNCVSLHTRLQLCSYNQLTLKVDLILQCELKGRAMNGWTAYGFQMGHPFI